MFDLRYHVASLAAVFLALTIGIVLGVGISDRAFPQGTEREVLENEIQNLRQQVDAYRQEQTADADTQRAADAIMRETYPVLVSGRLRSAQIAVVFVGPVDAKTSDDVQRALASAGAPPILRLRAIKVPVDRVSLENALRGRAALTSYAGASGLRALGEDLGRELIDGGRTPLWDGLARQLVEERSGGSESPADAVVVARSAEPQHGSTARFLAGLYAGLADGGVPAVGVEQSGSKPAEIGAFQRAGLSTVDAVDTPAGRAALVLLLAGAQPGDYGFKRSAHDGPLPAVASVLSPSARG